MNLPNKLTMMRVIMVPFFMVFAAMSHMGTLRFNATYALIAGILFAVASFTDFLDGYLARKNHLVTDFGKFMDPLADKMLTTAAIIYMVVDGVCSPVVLAIIMFREFAVAGVRMIAAESGTVIAANMWGKVKTVLQMVTIIFYYFAMALAPAVYAAYLWRLEHIGHNWNLIMAEPVPPFYLFLAKLLVVTKLVLLTQAFVFVLYWFCGRVFAGFTAPPPAITIFYLVRSVLGGLAVVAAQLLFSMVIRSFALPVFLGLAGGVSGMLLASRGYWYAWPYCLMQRGMNANQSSDMLADSYLGFALACVGWLALILLAVQLLLSHQDVKVR